MKTKNYPWRYGWFLGMYYMANGIYQGYASKYFEATGMSTAMLSVILAFTPLISIFTQPLWGTVGDRAKSRNRVLGFLTVASAALVLLYCVSASFWWLLPMSILFSSVYTSIQPMGDSIVLEALSPENHAFGPLRMMGTISFALTNLVWGLILTPGRMNLVVYMTAVMLMMVLVSTRVLPPTEGHQSSTGRKMNMTAILKMNHMPGLLILLMLLQLTMGYFYSFFSIYFTSMPGGSSRLLGLCYFMSAMSEIPFLLNADRLFERLGVGKLLSIAAIALTLRWTILGTCHNVYAVMASQLLHGWGFIVMTVSMAKYVSATIPDELKASGQMLISVVGFGIARVFGILGGGLVADAMGSVQKGFLLMAIVAGVGLIAFVPRYLAMKPLNGKGEA